MSAIPHTHSDAPPPLKPNGGGIAPPSALAAIAAATIDPAIFRKLEQLRGLAHGIEAKKIDIGKQQTVVASAKSKLDDERESLNQLEREKDELQEELDTLALGRHSERLFPVEAVATAPAQATEPPPVKTAKDLEFEDQDAFDAALLGQIGVKGATADKLAADGIKTGKDLRQWVQSHPRRKIGGIGDSAVSKLSDLMAEWYEKRRAARPAPPAAPVDTPAATARELEPREPTEQELDAGEFVPETAAWYVAYLSPWSDGSGSTAATVLNDVEGFKSAWQAIDEVQPGTPGEEGAPFNAKGWEDLKKAAIVLRKHHGLPDAPANSLPLKGEPIATLGVSRQQVQAASIVTIGNDLRRTTAAKAEPFEMNGRLWVTTEIGVMEPWYARVLPLYPAKEFEVKFIQHPTRFAPEPSQTDEQRREYYTGVVVKVGREEYAIGPRGESRRLIDPSHGQPTRDDEPATEDESEEDAPLADAASFADDDIADDSHDTIVKFLGRRAKLNIDLGRWGNGQWAIAHSTVLSKRHFKQAALAGRHSSRPDAIDAAMAEVRGWIQQLQSSDKLNVGEKAAAKEIAEQLDALKKKLTADMGGGA